MKKLMVLALLLLPSLSFATDIWLSSNTATAETLAPLCGGGKRSVLHGICSNTAATASVTVYNSSYSAAGGPICVFNANSQRCNYYDTSGSKGLSYTKTGTADVTILYDCH